MFQFIKLMFIIVPFLEPVKQVERADALMQRAHVLYEKHEPMMNPNDRRWAEDQLIYAKDFRHGVEEKSILARAEQAKRYFERAQMALETVKGAVDVAIEIRNRKEVLATIIVPP